MLMSFFRHDGLKFRYADAGEGTPFVFQHGLGGDVDQPFSIFLPPPGFRLLAFDCRGHGETRPLGNPAKIGFVPFANDLLVLMDRLGLNRAVVGGISMGAGVALNFALRFPQRIAALVLARPAWLDRPLPGNLEIYPRIAQLIRHYGVQEGLELFRQSKDYLTMKRLSSDAVASLVGQFEHPRAVETVVKLERIAQDAPNRDRREWAAIQVPVLVLANQQDPIHPFEYGRTLAGAIPSAVFRELTPKSISKERHALDVQRYVEEFLKHYFVEKGIVTC